MAAETINPLDYAAPSKHSGGGWLVFAVISAALSILEFPWMYVVGVAAWLFIVGDNQPTTSQNDLIGALLAIPPTIALLVGIGPVIQRRSRSARLVGALGLALSVAWLWFLIPR
jgi:hypothetical protein